MARSLTSGMNTAVAAEQSTVVRLIQLEHSGGTARWATAAQDISWNSQTWSAIGGVLELGAAQESSDLRAAGLSVELSGVDGSIVSLVMTNSFRGYEVMIYRAHLTDGDVVADPYLEFRGYQNEPYEISDDPKTEEGGGGTVTVKTRWVSRLAALNRILAVRTNLHSHRALLKRAGLPGTDLADDFFKFVPALRGRLRTIRWGSEVPADYVPGEVGEEDIRR